MHMRIRCSVPQWAEANALLGRWKVTEVRTFLRVREFVPLRAAFFAAFAFASWGLAPAVVRHDVRASVRDRQQWSTMLAIRCTVERGGCGETWICVCGQSMRSDSGAEALTRSHAVVCAMTCMHAQHCVHIPCAHPSSIAVSPVHPSITRPSTLSVRASIQHPASRSSRSGAASCSAVPITSTIIPAMHQAVQGSNMRIDHRSREGSEGRESKSVSTANPHHQGGRARSSIRPQRSSN